MLIRHSMTYVAAKVVPGVLGMATTSILTHVLMPAQFGLYGLSLVVMAFGVNIAFDWVLLCLTRFYEGRHRDSQVVGTVLHLFGANVLITGAIFLVVWQLDLLPAAEAFSYAMGVVLMWSTAWFELMAGIEIVNFRPLVYFAMNLGRAFSVLVLAVGAAWLTRDPVLTAGGTAVGIFLGSLLRKARLPRGKATFDARLAHEMLTFGIPLAGALVMGSAGYTGTRLMVEWLGTVDALGYYTAVFVLVQNMLVVIAAGVGAASYQLAVRAVASGDPEAIRHQLLNNGTLLLAVMAPASLGAALTAKGIAVTLVGVHYANAVESLTPWMAAGAFFMTIRGNYLDHAFQLGHRPFLQLRVLALSAVISIALAFWLIPSLGPEGAAIAVTIALAIACVHARVEGAAAFPMPLPIAGAAKIVTACAAMAVGILSLNGDTPERFVLQVLLGGVVYSTCIVAFNVFGLRQTVIKYLVSRSWLWTRRML